MTLKDKILSRLYENKGGYVSGEALAVDFGVSRAAVNKAVSALKRMGYDICAAPNKGYALAAGDDTLSAIGIESYLKEKHPGFSCGPVRIYDTIDSTNSEAKRLAANGLANGAVIIADAQSGGRGRLSRGFFSPPGSGLYMSVVVRPDFDISRAVLVTAAAAVAAARAVSEVAGAEVEIKWVNDLYFDGKKVAGILTEALSDFESGRVETVIIGIGINVRPPDGGFPGDISSKAGNLDSDCRRNDLAAEIAYNVMTIIDNIEERSFLAEYRRRSSVLGRDIEILPEGRPAKAVWINEDANLEVRYPDGTLDTIIAGEISILPI